MPKHSRIAGIIIIQLSMFISCINPRLSYEKGLKKWIGKPISEFIKTNGAPREVVKIPHKHDVYIFGKANVVSSIETKNPQIISTTIGGGSTTNAYGNAYGGNNYAVGTATSNTYVTPQTTVTTFIPGSSTKVSRYIGCEVWMYVRDGKIFDFHYEGNRY